MCYFYQNSFAAVVCPPAALLLAKNKTWKRNHLRSLRLPTLTLPHTWESCCCGCREHLGGLGVIGHTVELCSCSSGCWMQLCTALDEGGGGQTSVVLNRKSSYVCLCCFLNFSRKLKKKKRKKKTSDRLIIFN